MKDGDRCELQFFEINCKHSCFYDEVEKEGALDDFELNAGGKRDFPDKQPERSQGRRQVRQTGALEISSICRITVHLGQTMLIKDFN